MDNDEDIHLARVLGINHLEDNEGNNGEKLIWNILLRAYCDRKLYHGSLPIYSRSLNANTTKISDKLLKKNSNLYENVSDLMEYLMIRDVKLTSLEIDALEKKIENSMTTEKLEHIDTPLFLLNDHDKWLLGNTSLLVTEYFKILGVEAEQALLSFEYFDMFENLMKYIKEILIHSPPHRFDNRLSHYEYFYLKKSLKSIEIAFSVLFAIHERFLILHESAEDVLTKAEADLDGNESGLSGINQKMDISKRILDKLCEVMQKLNILLKEYSVRCDDNDMDANALTRKITLMIRFMKGSSIKREDLDNRWKTFISARIFDVDTEDYRKLFHIVESLSEKLMNEVIFKSKIKTVDMTDTSEGFINETTIDDVFDLYY